MLSSRRILLIAVLGLTPLACNPALYVPTEADVQPEASLSVLTQGRRSYAEKCGSCHRLRLPESLTEQEWRTAIERMRSRAKLDSSEESVILKYLRSAGRKRESD